MYAIYDKKTNEIDCDPEPMVFGSRKEAVDCLQSYIDESEFYISEVF